MLPWLVGTNRASSKISLLLQIVGNVKSLRVEPHPKAEDALAHPRTCLVGMHSHGHCPLIILPWMASRPDLFSNLALAQSSRGKFVPSIGLPTTLSSCKTIDVTKKDITTNIQEGHYIALFPGGSRGMIECNPDICIIRHSNVIRLVK